jgi:hypothetical protein
MTVLCLSTFCLAGLLNGDEKSIEAAKVFFGKKFPKNTPLALISSRKDHIARPDDIKRLFVISCVSRKVRVCSSTHSQSTDFAKSLAYIPTC